MEPYANCEAAANAVATATLLGIAVALAVSAFVLYEIVRRVRQDKALRGDD